MCRQKTAAVKGFPGLLPVGNQILYLIPACVVEEIRKERKTPGTKDARFGLPDKFELPR